MNSTANPTYSSVVTGPTRLAARSPLSAGYVPPQAPDSPQDAGQQGPQASAPASTQAAAAACGSRSGYANRVPAGPVLRAVQPSHDLENSLMAAESPAWSLNAALYGVQPLRIVGPRPPVRSGRPAASPPPSLPSSLGSSPGSGSSVVSGSPGRWTGHAGLRPLTPAGRGHGEQNRAVELASPSEDARGRGVMRIGRRPGATVPSYFAGFSWQNFYDSAGDQDRRTLSEREDMALRAAVQPLQRNAWEPIHTPSDEQLPNG